MVKGDKALLGRAIYHLTLEALRLGRSASVRVQPLSDTASVELGWDPPNPSVVTHDPWHKMGAVVARAHGGTLDRGPGWARLSLPR
jgi:hypothetical protein